MPADCNIPDPPETAPNAPVDTSEPALASDHANATVGASRPHDEAALREWEGLPPDTMILAPAFDPPPMRCPDGVWAMLVAAVGIVSDADPDRAGEVALFTGCWVPDQPPADGLYDGDLVVRLTNPDGPTYPLPYNHVADVEMLLAYQGRWQRVGRWCGVDDRWPHIVAPTAAAVMGLHGALREAAAPGDATQSLISPPPTTGVRAGVTELLDAGLVKAGEELLFWNRGDLGARHTARIRADGALVLADGRVYPNPADGANTLGGNHQNIWGAFHRASDGRTLSDLRAELHAWRGR